MSVLQTHTRTQDLELHPSHTLNTPSPPARSSSPPPPASRGAACGWTTRAPSPCAPASSTGGCSPWMSSATPTRSHAHSTSRTGGGRALAVGAGQGGGRERERGWQLFPACAALALPLRCACPPPSPFADPSISPPCSPSYLPTCCPSCAPCCCCLPQGGHQVGCGPRRVPQQEAAGGVARRGRGAGPLVHQLQPARHRGVRGRACVGGWVGGPGWVAGCRNGGAQKCVGL
jgi:hypothetical protein